MYTSNLSVEKIRSRLSFELNKLVFRLFSLILLSDNEIDFYFCTPFTTIWLHCAHATGTTLELRVGVVGAMHSPTKLQNLLHELSP